MANNPQNIVPNSERTPEERKEIARKGGIASGAARRERKTLREICRELLAEEKTLTDGSVVSRGMIMVSKQIAKATEERDTQAFNAICNLTGDLTQQIQIATDEETAKAIHGEFERMYKPE